MGTGSLPAYTPLPFPGDVPGWLVAGITPPKDRAGQLVDIAELTDAVPSGSGHGPMHGGGSDALGAMRTAFSAPGWPVYWLRHVHGAEVITLSPDERRKERSGSGTPGAQPPRHAPLRARRSGDLLDRPDGPHGHAQGGTRGLPATGRLGVADALVTARPGVLLLTQHADCPPLLLWDAEWRAVGLAHAGRWGAFANVAAAVVSALGREVGSEPRALAATIGPGIRACCYEVGPEVVEEAETLGYGAFVERRGESAHLDVLGIIAHQLREAGVARIVGEREAECTRCGPTGLHSYRRRSGGSRPRFAAVAGIRGVEG